MKTLIAMILLAPTIAAAQYRPLETRDDARRRHEAERYQIDRSGQQPLGGYRERLGDPGGAVRDDPYRRPPTRFDEPTRDTGLSRDPRSVEPVVRPIR